MDDERTLVHECNQLSKLSKLGNSLSQFTGSTLSVPSPSRFGKYILDETIAEADSLGKYNNQWNSMRAVPEARPFLVKTPQLDTTLKDFNKLVLKTDLVLSPNALTTNNPLAGEKCLGEEFL